MSEKDPHPFLVAVFEAFKEQEMSTIEHMSRLFFNEEAGKKALQETKEGIEKIKLDE